MTATSAAMLLVFIVFVVKIGGVAAIIAAFVTLAAIAINYLIGKNLGLDWQQKLAVSLFRIMTVFYLLTIALIAGVPVSVIYMLAFTFAAAIATFTYTLVRLINARK